jgi:hypothetical protein
VNFDKYYVNCLLGRFIRDPYKDMKCEEKDKCHIMCLLLAQVVEQQGEGLYCSPAFRANGLFSC